MLLKLPTRVSKLFVVNDLRGRLAHARLFCYTSVRQFYSFASVALMARVKPGKLYEEPRYGGCVYLGASPFVISSGLFQGLTRNPARGCALSLACRCQNQRGIER